MAAIERLLQIMKRLRDPQRGCPWDLQQNFRTVAPYTIEEAYEVADAIERDDLDGLRDELGDLLFQVVFHSQMAQDQGAFTFDDVVAGICDKMERRHPHVFGTAEIADAAQQTIAWEELKRRERAATTGADNPPATLANVPVTLPALTRANKLGKRAAQVGFEWPDVVGALDKVREEIDELRHEIVQAGGVDKAAAEHEVGDVLFSVVNICRYLDLDPERALRDTNRRFERRFGYVESKLREQGRTPEEASLAEMDALWEEGKQRGL